MKASPLAFVGQIPEGLKIHCVWMHPRRYQPFRRDKLHSTSWTDARFSVSEKFRSAIAHEVIRAAHDRTLEHALLDLISIDSPLGIREFLSSVKLQIRSRAHSLN